MTMFEAGIKDYDTVVLLRTPLRCATSSYDGTARVWCVETGECKFSLSVEENDGLHCARLSPDGQTILTWSLNGCGVVWSVSGGEALCQLDASGDSVSGDIPPEFSPDG